MMQYVINIDGDFDDRLEAALAQTESKENDGILMALDILITASQGSCDFFAELARIRARFELNNYHNFIEEEDEHD